MTNEELAIRIQQGEKELLDRLWEQNKGFIYERAYQLYNQYTDRCKSCGVEDDDIIQIGFFALCEAVQAYKPESGYKLTTYMKYPLKTHFKVLLGERTTKRDPLNQCNSLNELAGDDTDTEKLDLVADPESGAPFDELEEEIFNNELHHALETAFLKLSTKQSSVIRRRYLEGKQQGQIAADMGKSQERVRQIEVNGMKKLRQNQKLREFHDEILANAAYKGTGLTAFKYHGSSVERAVMRVNQSFSRT
jgi:RNA polymerase sigma factor (sigma-70 family)